MEEEEIKDYEDSQFFSVQSRIRSEHELNDDKIMKKLSAKSFQLTKKALSSSSGMEKIQ
jgi:hypothetical protein